MVHVLSQWRQRQQVVALITLARVSIVRPLQKGHAVGRVTASGRLLSNCMTHAGGSWTIRLFKSEQAVSLVG